MRYADIYCTVSHNLIIYVSNDDQTNKTHKHMTPYQCQTNLTCVWIN